jgi:hypothetical protein
MSKSDKIDILLRILKGDDLSDCAPGEWDAVALTQLAILHKQAYRLLQFARQNTGLFPGELIMQIENHCRKSAFRSLSQLNELKQIAGRFNELGIPYVIVKGPQLSRMLYGREAMKESVDLDIMLVNGINDLMQVHELLGQLGYSKSNLNNYKRKLSRWFFVKAKREVNYHHPLVDCTIDLHVKPGTNTFITDKYFKHFFSDLVSDDLEGTPVNVLPDETYFIYLCYHGALHQFMRLDWLMDIRTFLALKKDTMDFTKMRRIAHTMRAENHVYLVLIMLRKYFGDAAPVAVEGNIPTNRRMRFLANVCSNMLYGEALYWKTFRGRLEKIAFVMLLTRGFAAKVDWLLGILLRTSLRFIR